MKNFIKNIYITFLAILLITSCSRKSDVVGPVICPSSDFKLTTPFSAMDASGNSTANTQVDLISSYVKLSASFSEEVRWSIKLVGQTSGAQKVFSGNSKVLDVNWYGEPTSEVVFQKDEFVSFTLFVDCFTEAKGVGQLKISTIPSYVNFADVVANYDGVADVGGPYNKDPLYPCKMSVLNTSSPLYIASPQGGNYMNFSCSLAPEASEWYFGGMYFNNIKAVAAKLLSNPEQVYFNVYCKGADNSQAQFIFQENVYGIVQKRKVLITVTSSWTMYSVKLSDIGVINPNKLENFDLNLGAAISKSNKASVDFDAIMFTEGSAFGK